MSRIIVSNKIDEATINWLEVEKHINNEKEKSEQYLMSMLES
jgi:hypothetical protein